jgi:hypothetical protein
MAMTIKRFRPRFTLRTLAIVTTMVCAFFGAWEATKRYGVRNMQLGSVSILGHADSPFPLIVRRCEAIRETQLEYGYYLWLFGPKFRLPFESD